MKINSSISEKQNKRLLENVWGRISVNVTATLEVISHFKRFDISQYMALT